MNEDPQFARTIAGCKKQDEASQILLYRQFYSYGMSICLRYAKNRESAVEMLNDGFFKVFLKIEQYHPDLPFKPWLRRVLIHAAIDHYRKYDQTKPPLEDLPSLHDPVYNEGLDQLQYQDLLDVLQKLPPAYRLVFNLSVIEGLTHKEISKELGIAVGTSKSNLAKARKQLQVLVRDYLGIHHKSE